MAVISQTGLEQFRANRTYHVTSRAIGNLQPFKHANEKTELLERIGNHLSDQPTHNQWGRPYVKLGHELAMLSFNVMNNHSHEVVHQYTIDAIRKLMSRVMARQAESFNQRTGWRGKVFSPFNATPFEELIDPTQIKDMVAYVELNDPIKQFETPHASFQVLAGNLKCDWYDPAMVLGVFGGAEGYCEYMNRRGPAIIRRKLIEWEVSPRRHPFREISASDIAVSSRAIAAERTDPASNPVSNPLRTKRAQLTIP